MQCHLHGLVIGYRKYMHMHDRDGRVLAFVTQSVGVKLCLWSHSLIPAESCASQHPREETPVNDCQMGK